MLGSSKLENDFIFELVKTKIWANFTRNYRTFTQKIVIKLSKVKVWDPSSGIRKKSYPGSVVKKAPDPDPQRYTHKTSDFKT